MREGAREGEREGEREGGRERWREREEGREGGQVGERERVVCVRASIIYIHTCIDVYVLFHQNTQHTTIKKSSDCFSHRKRERVCGRE